MRRICVIIGMMCIMSVLLFSGCTYWRMAVPSDTETSLSKNTAPTMTITTQSTVCSTTKTTKQLPIQTTSQNTVLHIIPKTTTQTLTPVTARTFGEVHPHITTYLEKDVYDLDETVRFYMVDPTNTGFAFDTDFELWEANGDTWVKKSRFPSVEVTRILKMSPIPGKTSLKTSYLMNLAHYQNMQYGTKYKITVQADGYILSEEFTAISQ